MKKVLIVVVVLALAVWVLTWFRNPAAVATSTAKPWPGGLGPLDTAADKAPALKTNAAAVKLMTLANALTGTEAVETFLKREVARGDLTIGAPPALPDVTAIRALLLREPITWERRVGVGDAEASKMRGVQMTSARALIASAVAKAHARDRAAWADLEAAWKLARSLEPHTQQMMLQTAAMSIARMINAVAWKMPLPAPAWLAEVQARDTVRPLLEAYQLQTAEYAKSGFAMFPTKSLATSVEHDRLIAEELFKTTQCDVNTRMNELGTDLTSVWRRAFRYRAEREATANALRVRDGKPIQTTSVCTDGAWTFDGTTLRFSRQIPTNPPEWSMPLVLRVKP